MKRVVGVVAGVATLVAGLVGPGAAHAVPGQGARGLVWGPCPSRVASGLAEWTGSGAPRVPDGPDLPDVTGALTATAQDTGLLGDVLGPIGAVPADAVRAGVPGRQPQQIDCATLRVPLDPREPSGRQITLALNRIRGAAAAGGGRLGTLLVNPGGPGGSGLGMARYAAASLPRDVAARFDVVGFAPRGVGPSEPALSCVDPRRFYAAPRPDNVPRTKADEDVLVSRAREYADGCAARWGWFLPHLTTENTARDMDAIRAALGEGKISYLGYSYGTYLGAVYATLFPQRVRRLVLDSVVDPDGVWYDANIAQDHSFDLRHRDFLAWVARHDDAYGLGRTQQGVSHAWYAMRSRLRERPAGAIVGPSELDDIYSEGGYSNRLWPKLAAAFSAYALRSDAAGLVRLFHGQAEIDPAEENSYAVYLGVECRDAPWPRSWARWHADTVRTHASAPFMAWPNAVYNAPCAFWPVRGGTPIRVGAANLPPVLLIQAQHDAATPYAGALHLRDRFPTARLLSEGGGNHGVSLAGNGCVDRLLAAYLLDGTTPAARGTTRREPGLSCPGVPDPQPAGSPAGQAARHGAARR
ncbi:alpha/beta hydrolase [Microbispora oryzae]|uniref:alpha/beta hydrolase n=1 Tax=Microbispora oryzae TaxID=2806554 RepID=UPI0027DE827C|nr:alpha/beta hydrolase [Microbispora oryzae]